MSPKTYRKQISNIGIEGMKVDVSTIQKAMNTLHQMEEYKNILKKIRFNLRSDIRKVRIEYMKKIQDVDELAKKTGRFKRKMSTEKIIKKKKELRKERDIKITAYEIIESIIENYLNQIEDSKVYINNHIQEKVLK